jgi:acyl carrier protein
MYLEKIQKIIHKKTGHEIEELIPTAHFQEDLNIGEIEFLDIIRDVEEEYELDLSEYTEDIETLEDLVNALTEELE